MTFSSGYSSAQGNRLIPANRKRNATKVYGVSTDTIVLWNRNAAAEAAGAAHDATTRNIIEKILANEEQHLSWLDTEIALYDTLGEPLYCASRLQTRKVSA